MYSHLQFKILKVAEEVTEKKVVFNQLPTKKNI